MRDNNGENEQKVTYHREIKPADSLENRAVKRILQICEPGTISGYSD